MRTEQKDLQETENGSLPVIVWVQKATRKLSEGKQPKQRPKLVIVFLYLWRKICHQSAQQKGLSLCAMSERVERVTTALYYVVSGYLIVTTKQKEVTGEKSRTAAVRV